MAVGVLEAGQHHRPGEIDHPGGRPPHAVHLARRSHRDDAARLHRHRVGRPPGGVDGVNDAVSQDQVGRHRAMLPTVGDAVFKAMQRPRRLLRGHV